MKKIHSVLTGILIVALLCPAAMAAEPEVTEEQRQAMDFVFDHGILQSDSTGAFQPHQPVSRAQMVGALYEMEGRPEVDTLPSFTDVAPEQPNAQAIAWAAAEGIACGYGGGVFGPDDAMTHEQAATILWRYAQYHSEDVSVGEDTNILSYEDAVEISEYAISAMQWACAAGIMGGERPVLLPGQPTTQLELSEMLYALHGSRVLAELALSGLVENNSRTAILSQFTSMTSLGFYDYISEGLEILNYFDGQIFYSNYADVSFEIYSTDGLYGLDEDGYAAGLIIGDVADYYEYPLFAPGPGSESERVAAHALKDGMLMFTGILSEEESALNLVESMGMEAKQGDILEFEYVMDAETLVLLRQDMILCRADGTRQRLMHTECAYNVEMPDEAKQLVDREQAEGNTVTVTVVANPGTAEEMAYARTFVKGDSMQLISFLEKPCSLYWDDACTQPISDEDPFIPTEDVTVYLGER